MQTTAPNQTEVLHIIQDHCGKFEYDFLHGLCWALFAHLRLFFPQAVAWYDPVVGHVYTEIDGVFYDVRGVMQKTPRHFRLMDDAIEMRRAISQMARGAEKIFARINRFQTHITRVYTSPHRRLPG